MAHFRTFLALGVSLSALAVPAYAQDAPAPAPADEAQPADTTAQEQDDEEAIVITADRREQSLQDFAGTAATFSGDDLKKRGIQNISDLNDVLPGLTVANNGANREVWIRGIGSSNNTLDARMTGALTMGIGATSEA